MYVGRPVRDIGPRHPVGRPTLLVLLFFARHHRSQEDWYGSEHQERELRVLCAAARRCRWSLLGGIGPRRPASRQFSARVHASGADQRSNLNGPRFIRGKGGVALMFKRRDCATDRGFGNRSREIFLGLPNSQPPSILAHISYTDSPKPQWNCVFRLTPIVNVRVKGRRPC